MEIAAADLILGARDFHMKFSDQEIPDAVALRQIGRLSLEVIHEYAKDAPGAVSKPHAIENSEILDALGTTHQEIAIPPWFTVVPNLRIQIATDSRRSAPIVLTDVETLYPQDVYEEDFDPDVLRVAVADSVMIPCDLRELGGSTHGWERARGTLTYRYVPIPVPKPFTDMEGTLDLPHQPIEATKLKLAIWMAKRVGLMDEAAAWEGQYMTVIEQHISLVSEQHVSS